MAQRFYKPKTNKQYHLTSHTYSKEIRRQIFHLLLGPAIIVLYYYEIINKNFLLFLLLIGFVLSIIAIKAKIPFISFMLESFDRKEARFPGEGALFYVLSCYIVLALFQEGIAFASIMILAFGDSMTTLIGKRYGKTRIGARKTMEGTIAGIIAGFFGAYFFVSAKLAFIGTLAAMVLEAIELKFFGKVIDDNLFIPIISAIVMKGVEML